MIKAPLAPLADETLADLQTWQGEVDGAGDYAARIEAAEAQFKRRRPQVPFRPVLVALAAMCSGSRRCMYCEDNCADEVEHYRPKALYPELVFAWTNYLFACASCNRRKSTKFPLFATGSSSVVTFARVNTKQPFPPPVGTSVLLDPRQDDPLAFLRLDLVDTFRFRAVAPKGTVEHVRATKTIEVLGLNERDELPKGRRAIYESHVSHLHRAAAARRDPSRSAEVARVRAAVQQLSCGIVWHEMKRRRDDVPEVRAAFAELPEALGW
jgi:uncharacterized protein (TIGR02646 family)